MSIQPEQLADALDAFHNAALGCANQRGADGGAFDVVASIVEGFNAVAATLRDQAHAQPTPPRGAVAVEPITVEDRDEVRATLRVLWNDAVQAMADVNNQVYGLSEYHVRRENAIDGAMQALCK